MICSTPRCGSSLLSLGLAEFGSIGVPIEYFNPTLREFLAARWGCDSGFDSYLAALHGHRATGDGLFGAKLHWDQLVELRSELLEPNRTDDPDDIDATFLERPLPACRYIRIRREDLVSQAVSLFMALSTGLWAAYSTAPVKTPPAPAYHFDHIHRCRQQVEWEEACWARFFQANEITPFVVVYEELEKAYAETLAATVAFIGANSEGREVPEPLIRKQRNRVSEEFRDAYLRDCRARGIGTPRQSPHDPLANPTRHGREPETGYRDIRELASLLQASRSRRLARRLRAAVVRRGPRG